METRFENRYFCDKKLLREFARKYSVGPTPLTTAITTPIVVLCLPVLVKGAMDGMELSVIPVAYLVLILIQFLPRLYAWSMIRNTKKQNDGILPETRVVFSDENIQMFEGMVHLTIEYRKIRKAVRLKNGYALFNGKRTAVLLKPEGFTEGTFEGFKVFLREKCPGIKIAE